MDGKLKLTYGGWYQRTTLHLSEIYDLFAFGRSNLELPKKKIADYHKLLDIKKVTREPGYLEFVKAKTNNGIEIRYYEDGLYVLEVEIQNTIDNSKKLLEDYFNDALSPAISYIFSLGAPTPKILANIKTVHPTVISVLQENPDNFNADQQEFGTVYSKMSAQDILVYKTPDYIFVVTTPKLEKIASDLVEMQIFFREFKDQLEKYLNIHRTTWEEISDIKERKMIRGTEVEKIRSKLDSYQRTISLISNRINQMGSYVRTRASISKSLNIEDSMRSLFQYKFEVLTDTLDYIKEIWKMSGDYLASAIQMIVEVKNQGTSRGIQSLQLITSIGVVSGILGYLARNDLPKFTTFGLVYFALIILATWLINSIIVGLYNRKKYRLKFAERAKNL